MPCPISCCLLSLSTQYITSARNRPPLVELSVALYFQNCLTGIQNVTYALSKVFHSLSSNLLIDLVQYTYESVRWWWLDIFHVLPSVYQSTIHSLVLKSGILKYWDTLFHPPVRLSISHPNTCVNGGYKVLADIVLPVMLQNRCNQSPNNARSAYSLHTSRKGLKTHLFIKDYLSWNFYNFFCDAYAMDKVSDFFLTMFVVVP